MQYVKFNLDEFRYVLSIADVVEIIPYVKLKGLTNVPEYIAGKCKYRGSYIPVIDLCVLFLKRPCNRKLSTRILIVEAVDSSPTNKLVGLIVEKATEIIKEEEDNFMDSSMYGGELPHAGEVLADSTGLMNRLHVRDIFVKVECKELFSAKTMSA
jgi:chemotaxis-related protein WspB